MNLAIAVHKDNYSIYLVIDSWGYTPITHHRSDNAIIEYGR